MLEADFLRKQMYSRVNHPQEVTKEVCTTCELLMLELKRRKRMHLSCTLYTHKKTSGKIIIEKGLNNRVCTFS